MEMSRKLTLHLINGSEINLPEIESIFGDSR